MKYKSAKKPERCPECGSEKIAEILYGLPAFFTGPRQELRDEKIVLGGCCVTGDNPAWECTSCNTVIYRMKIDLNDSVN